MKRSPMRIIELCVYILIIILAVAWLMSGGKLYNPPEVTAPPPIETTQPEETEPPIYVLPPKSEYQTGR